MTWPEALVYSVLSISVFAFFGFIFTRPQGSAPRHAKIEQSVWSTGPAGWESWRKPLTEEQSKELREFIQRVSASPEENTK